jgi:AraC-like DNA-binding protein/tetratricopeptide (TPR) repeat protein
MLAMPRQPLPHDVKKAIDLVRGDLARRWTVKDLARLCDVRRRTLEKHFRRFAGCAPLEFLRTARLDQARRKLIAAAPGASVTGVAMQCGLTHLGRFAVTYRERYGESPSDTLRYRRIPQQLNPSSFRLAACSERATLAILPFDLIGPQAACAISLGEEIAAALGRTGWVRIAPARAARYCLHGRVKEDGAGALRIRATLLDQTTSRYIWADCTDCAAGDLFGSPDWLSNIVSGALRSVVCGAEIDRAAGVDPAHITAWELSMQALPMVLAADPAMHATALELLDQAIARVPRDPIPIAMAAWCHGLRAGHHFTAHRKAEQRKVLELVSNASALTVGDPLAHAMLSAASMLAHDLTAAEAHARQALVIDGGSPWGWGRLAWVHAYRGETTKAIECCKIARVLAPVDPLNFVWSLGIAAANFELGSYRAAVQWYRRALAAQPKAIWINRFLAAALVHAGKHDEGKQSFRLLCRDFPELTIAEVRSGLPHTATLLDRVADGLENLGMRYS